MGKLIPSEVRATVEGTHENILIVRDYTKLPNDSNIIAVNAPIVGVLQGGEERPR